MLPCSGPSDRQRPNRNKFHLLIYYVGVTVFCLLGHYKTKWCVKILEFVNQEAFLSDGCYTGELIFVLGEELAPRDSFEWGDISTLYRPEVTCVSDSSF